MMSQRPRRVSWNIVHVKLVILSLFSVSFIAILLINNSDIWTARAYVSGPPPGYTGAPSEQTCSRCHSGPPPTGQFTIVVPQSYEPGQTYQITVQHATSDTSRRRWGFQLTGLTTDNTRAGTLQSTSGFTSVIQGAVAGGVRQNIQHNISGTFPGQSGGAFWTFDWIAPPSNVGPVTFYAAGNQANNNGATSGDQIYRSAVTVQPAATEPVRVLLSRDAGNDLVATITVTNPTATAIPDVSLTLVRASTLDETSFVDGVPVPQAFGTVAPSQSVVATVTFPGTAGVPAGFAGLVRVDLSYAGGTYSETERVITP